VDRTFWHSTLDQLLFCFAIAAMDGDIRLSNVANSRCFFIEVANIASPNGIRTFSIKRSRLRRNDLHQEPRNTRLQYSENPERHNVFGLMPPGATPIFARRNRFGHGG
jgi:hypothetical protein